MQIASLSQWVNSKKNGKIRKEKKRIKRNALNNNEL